MNPTERQLLSVLTEPTDRTVGGLAGRAKVVEELLAELFGRHVYDRRAGVHGPDIFLSRQADTPIAIEVKVSRLLGFGNNIQNRVSDSLPAQLKLDVLSAVPAPHCRPRWPAPSGGPL